MTNLRPWLWRISVVSALAILVCAVSLAAGVLAQSATVLQAVFWPLWLAAMIGFYLLDRQRTRRHAQ